MLVQNSSAASLFGYDIFGKDCPKIIRQIWFGLRWIDNHIGYPLLYRLHPRHRYHVVKTDLRPGYYDVDEIMFRACFALLGRYVEDELGRGHGPDLYRGYRLHAAEGDEFAIDLWVWYSYDLFALEQEAAADYRAFIAKYGYDYLENLKDQKLRALIEMRQALWT